MRTLKETSQITGKMLTDESACMNERTLNSMLGTKDSLNNYQNKPVGVDDKKKHIIMAKEAPKHHQNYLEFYKLINSLSHLTVV